MKKLFGSTNSKSPIEPVAEILFWESMDERFFVTYSMITEYFFSFVNPESEPGTAIAVDPVEMATAAGVATGVATTDSVFVVPEDERSLERSSAFSFLRIAMSTSKDMILDSNDLTIVESDLSVAAEDGFSAKTGSALESGKMIAKMAMERRFFMGK